MTKMIMCMEPKRNISRIAWYVWVLILEAGMQKFCFTTQKLWQNSDNLTLEKHFAGNCSELIKYATQREICFKKMLNILKTNEIAERPGEVHGLWVWVAARQLGVLDVPHQEQGGAEPADDRSGGGTTSSGAIYNLSWHKPKSIYIMLRNA